MHEISPHPTAVYYVATEKLYTNCTQSQMYTKLLKTLPIEHSTTAHKWWPTLGMLLSSYISMTDNNNATESNLMMKYKDK